MQTIRKNKNGYGYKYADLSQIHNYLEENQMTYFQYIEVIDGNDYIMTVLVDKDGNEGNPLRGCRVVQATLSGKSNPAQEQGSAITYARRYSLLMALGLATEDDDAESLSTYTGKSKASYKRDKAPDIPWSPSPELVEDMKSKAEIVGWVGDREKGMLSYFGVSRYEQMSKEQVDEFNAMAKKELERMG